MVFDVRTCSTPRCPWAPPLSSSKAPSSCSNAGARARPRRPGPWRKTWRKMGQHHGKPWKTMENHGKTMENHGKPWKTMEKPWKCSYGKYIFIETLSGARETKPEFQQKKTSIFAEHEFGWSSKRGWIINKSPNDLWMERLFGTIVLVDHRVVLFWTWIIFCSRWFQESFDVVVMMMMEGWFYKLDADLNSADFFLWVDPPLSLKHIYTDVLLKFRVCSSCFFMKLLNDNIFGGEQGAG